MTALSVNKTGLQRALARARGWNTDPALWTTQEKVNGPDIIAAGLRRFYFPPPLPGERESWVWSFLRPQRTITVWPTVTGTISTAIYSSPSTTVTAVAALFYPSMVGKVLTGGSGADFTIASYTSSTVVVVTGDANAETTFTITADGDYRLPDDFADVLGAFTFAVGANRYHTLEHRNIVQVLQRRASHGSSWNARPAWFAIRPETFVETTGQRHALVLQAVPDKAYVLTYKSAVEPDLVSAESYARGGTPHVQTVIEAILAEAEAMLGDEMGVHEAKFMERLAASVSFDRNANSADTLGPTINSSGKIAYGPDRGDSTTIDVFGLYTIS